MTATDPTPEGRPVDRGAMAGALAYTAAMTDATHPHVWRYVSRSVITAALSDPDDPDSLARTLYVLHWTAEGRESVAMALSVWETSVEHTREHWRAVADGLRMMLTGQGS